MLSILLILTAAFAILSWSDLHKGLWLLTAVLPSYLLRVEILGVPTTLLEMLVVTFIVIWFSKRRVPPITKGGVAVPVFLLIAATVSVFVAPDLANALGVWKAYFLEPILLFLIVRYELSTTKPMNTNVPAPTPWWVGAPTPAKPGVGGDTFVSSLFVALGVSALVLSVIAIAQWLTGLGIPIPWDIERRVTGVFDYPNALGLFLGPIVIIAVLSAIRHKSAFWLTTAVASFVAIVLAQSEAAIVSILATLGIAGLVNAKTRFATAVALIVAVLAICLSSWRGVVIDKLTLQDYSGQVRLSQWSETIDMLGDHWLLGVGLSGYPTVFAPYHRAEHIEIFQYPHNIVLNIWVELGLLGLLAFAFLAWHVLRFIRSTLPALSTEALAKVDPQLLAFLALLQMTIHGLVDVPYFKNDLAILTWILLAIVLAYVPPTRAADSSR